MSKILYHGTPHKLKELRVATPRGDNDFNTQTGVYMTDDITEAKLYSIARDKARLNKGWGIRAGKLILRKDKWHPEGPNRLNKVGYLYCVNTADYQKNPYPDAPHEYIIKHNVVPDKIIKVDQISVSDKIIYLDKPEYDKFWNIDRKSGGATSRPKPKQINPCRIPKDAIIKYGSGGSRTIIVITSDAAYKYFPMFLATHSDKIRSTADQLTDIKYEINACKELTKLFIKTSKTPHIIGYLDTLKCQDTPRRLFDTCVPYADFLMSKDKSSKHCEYIYKNHPIELLKPMLVLQMEKGAGSLEDDIEAVAKKPVDTIYAFLDRLLFQVCFTLETIKLKFPRYAHNDLFIRNILVADTSLVYKPNQYLRYYYKDKVFDVPAPGLFIKITDLGMNQLNAAFYKKHNIRMPCPLNPHRDYFSILYDLYDGANLGGKSFRTLIKNKEKWRKVERYFDQFLDTKNIKKIIKNKKKKMLDWDWTKTLDPKVVKLLGLQPIKKYLKYFENVFPYNEKHYIIEEFG